MKPSKLQLISSSYSGVAQIREDLEELWATWRRQKLPLYLFLGLCFNLILAPAVFAAVGETFSRSQAYWMGALAIATLSLSIYLFFAMVVPEKF